jgi:DNA-binding beta-propeller fold protein YncE
MRRRIQTVSLFLATACLSAAAHAQTVIATIPITAYAGGGAVDPKAKLAYIPTGTNDANTNPSSQVTIVDEKTQTIAGYITFDSEWQAVSAALNYRTGLLYVGLEGGGLYVVNPKTRETVGYVNVPAACVAVNSETNMVYVSDFDQNLYAIDGATNTIVADVTVQGIENIAVNPRTNTIYAAVDFNPGKVAVVDGRTNQIIAEPTAASGLTFGVAVDPFRNIFYSSDTNQLSSSGTGTVSVYNGKTNTLTTSVTEDGYPALVVEDPVTFTVYASNYPEGTVDIIDGATNTQTGSVTVGADAQYMTDDPVNKLLYVGCQGPNTSEGYPTYLLYVIKTK